MFEYGNPASLAQAIIKMSNPAYRSYNRQGALQTQKRGAELRFLRQTDRMANRSVCLPFTLHFLVFLLFITLN
jgi:hypothetical protein